MATGLHLVLGEDEFLTERATTAIIAGHREEAPDPGQPPGVSRLSGAEVTSGQLLELLSPSLFGEERVVIVERAAELGKDPQAAVTSTASDLDEGTVLVVQHTGGGRAKALVAALRKAGASEHPADKIKRPSDLVAFVQNEFRSQRTRVSREVSEALVEAVGNDLRSLAAAADQLVSDTGGKVDVAAVRRYHSGVVGMSGFTVAERTVTGDLGGAMEALEWALHTGVPEVVLADALADAVHSIAVVAPRRNVDAGEFARQGIPPWKVKKIRGQARHWDADGIGRALQIVARLNGEVKGRAESSSFALERAVRGVGTLARP